MTQALEMLPGMQVRVREGYRKPQLVGMRGVVEKRWGGPDYVALDVRLEDGRSELFWVHQLDAVAPGRGAYYDGG